MVLKSSKGLDYNRIWPLDDSWYICAKEIKLIGLKLDVNVKPSLKQDKIMLIDGTFLKIVEYTYKNLKVHFNRAAVIGFVGSAETTTGIDIDVTRKERSISILVFYKNGKCEVEITSNTYFILAEPKKGLLSFRDPIQKLSHLVNWHTKRISPLFYDTIINSLRGDESLKCSFVWTSAASAAYRWEHESNPEIQDDDKFQKHCNM